MFVPAPQPTLAAENMLAVGSIPVVRYQDSVPTASRMPIGTKSGLRNITNQVVYQIIQDIQFIAADLAIGETYTLNATRVGTPRQSSFGTSNTAASPQYAASSMNSGCNISFRPAKVR